MPHRSSDHAVATARLLLMEYYESGRRSHTYESIARRSRLSRSTVARLAAEVRDVMPSMTEMQRRIEMLERRIDELEGHTSLGRVA